MRLTREYILSLSDQELYELAKSKIYEDIPQEKEECFLFDIDDDIEEYTYSVTDVDREMYKNSGLTISESEVVYPKLIVVKVWNDFLFEDGRFYYKRKIESSKLTIK